MNKIHSIRNTNSNFIIDIFIWFLPIVILFESCNVKPSDGAQEKKDVLQLLSETNDYDSLQKRDISNVDVVNGFRKVKLGLILDSVTCNTCHLEEIQDSLISILTISDSTIPLSIGSIQKAELIFFKKGLVKIKLFLQPSEYQIKFNYYNLVYRLYGKSNDTLPKKSSSSISFEGNPENEHLLHEAGSVWRSKLNTITLYSYQEEINSKEPSKKFTHLAVMRNRIDYILTYSQNNFIKEYYNFKKSIDSIKNYNLIEKIGNDL